MASTPIPPTLDPRPAEDHPHFPDWLARACGRELRRLRQAQGLSAYELAVPGVLSDQAILNNEGGKINPGLKTLARHCQRLGTSLPKLLEKLMS